MKKITAVFLLFAMIFCVAEASAGRTKEISSAGFSYRIGPLPSFVNPVDFPLSAKDVAGNEGNAKVLLYDRQISLLGREPLEYTHTEIVPLTSSGLQNLSQIYITFNPAYQKLVLHRIRIWRDGKAIDLTSRIKLDLMRREDDLDKNLYEGNVTAVGVLRDTRINDVIDVQYTISGTNPIFGKRYSNLFSITQIYPISRFRLGLLADRPVMVNAPAGVTVKRSKIPGGTLLYTVSADHLRPALFEAGMPSGYQPQKFLQISEYKSWSDVAEWAENLFKVDTTLPPEIQSQIENWKKENLSKERLAGEMLRWVQSQIRYFGIELGVNSHLPSQPNVTVERRFGDCKDKSLLLSTMLNSIGIQAEPALVSLGFTKKVGELIPSPSPFNHVIVKAVIAGKTYWLDATALPQYGDLDKLGETDYGHVLVLGAADPLQSADYSHDFENSLHETSSFSVISYKEPVQLTSRTVVNRNLAEFFRNLHTNQSSEEFAKLFQKTILRIYPGATPGELEYADDKINNLVTITTKFTIKDFFRYEPGIFSGMLYASSMLSLADLPDAVQRTSPYALPNHSSFAETLEVYLPDAVLKSAKSEDVKSGEFWTMKSNTVIAPRKIQQKWTLRANKEEVSPQKIGDYDAETKGIRSQMIMTLRLPIEKLSDEDKTTIYRNTRDLKNKYGNSESGRVGGQLKEAVNLVVVSRDIDSGKLNDKQLANAYKIRSTAYDDRGDVAHALADIRKALSLDPNNSEYLLSEAETLAGNGQFGEARPLFEKGIEIKKDTGADTNADLMEYGVDLHYLGQNDHAKDVLDEAIQQGADQMYVPIWRYIVSASDSDGKTALLSAIENAQDKSWPYPVAEMLSGKITPQDLIKSAESGDTGIQEDQYCEAYFYIGQKYLLEKDVEKAKAFFRKCVDLGVIPYMEYNYSLHELGMKKEPVQSRWWKF